MTAYETYLLFKKHCPNSDEQYSDDPAAVRRWKWHIERMESIPKHEPFFVPAYVREFFEQRAAKTWDDLPIYARIWYDYVKCFYPDVDVYAVGSFVNGDYVTKHCPPFVRWYRQLAGKSDKIESDYDYYTAAPINPDAPNWSDYVRYIPGDKMILIPMWNFEKLPESEREKVAEYIENNQWSNVVAINNKYAVSTHPVCCDINPLKSYYKSKHATGFFTAHLILSENGKKEIENNSVHTAG